MMSPKKVSKREIVKKSEIELSIERFLIDSDDEFFPDPIRYKDLRTIHSELVIKIQKDLSRLLNNSKIQYSVKQHYDWDVPKSNYVIRQGCSFHPYDSIIFHYIFNKLAPVIEPTLSKARYSYRLKGLKSKHIFGKRPTENWILFKKDIKSIFSNNQAYKYLVLTDVAGFFEYIQISNFKKQLSDMCGPNKLKTIELLNAMLKGYSTLKPIGMPQNCEPFSYLCTAFLDFFDKEMEANSIRHFRYVDDIRIPCKTMQDAKKSVLAVIRSLRTAHLNVNAAKTDIIHKDSEKFSNLFKDFPPILSDIDDAISKKKKSKINNLSPKLIDLTKQIVKKKSEFDEQIFRACIWRITKLYRFSNIDKVNIDSIGNTCLRLMDSMPSRSKAFLSLLVLHKDRAYVQNGLYNILLDCVYPWQEMLIWYVLVQAKKIKNTNILKLAQQRARQAGYDEGAKNYIFIFLGKHGNYQDKKYLAEQFQFTQSFRAKRSILIALQQFTDRNTVYNQISSKNNDFVLVSLVKYLRQLKEPEYVDVNKSIGTELAFS